MPSTSKKQHNLMAAVAHSPAFAKKVGIKQSVGEDFMKADKGKKFKGGGMANDKLKKMFKGKETYAEEMKEAKAIKSGKITPEEYAKGEGMEGEGMKKGGKVKKMAKGGAVEKIGPRTMSEDVEKGSNKLDRFGESAVQKRGHTKGKNLGDSGPTRMAKGGYVRSADGIASRGKTRGKYC